MNLRSGDPVWRKAPLVLLRYPGLFTALAVGALLLALTAAAYPLFLSGSGSKLLRAEIDDPLVGRYGVGLTYRTRNIAMNEQAPGTNRPLYEARGETFAELASRSPYLAPTETMILGPTVSLNDPEHPRRVRSGRLFAGEEALQHVEIIEGTDGPGVWIPDLVARGLRLGAGDRIRLSHSDREPVILPVDGVYGTLAYRPPGGYWLAWEPEIYPAFCQRECATPTQFMLADAEQVLSLARPDRLGEGMIDVGWQAPLRGGVRLSLDDARNLQRFAASIERTASDPSTEAGRILDCCHRASLTPIEPGTELDTSIDFVVEQADAQVASLQGPGGVLRVAGILVALAVLASAGVFSAGARSTEVRLLDARGTGPFGAGAKAALEALVPSIIGGAVGVGLAFVLVRLITAGSPPSGSAVAGAFVAGAAAVVISVVALGAVAAAASVRHAGRQRGTTSVLARVPWELAVLAFALFAAQRLPAGLGSRDVALDVQPPSAFLLLFPIAFVGGFAGLGARLFREGSGVLRRRGAGRRSASYLALHRVAGAPMLPVLLVAAAGLCVGVFVQGQSVVRSLERTVDAKAKVFVGSDVQAWVGVDTVAPPDFPLPATRASRARLAGTADEVRFDLLGVDPDTLADAAFWDQGFAEAPLEDLVARIETGDAGGPVPILVAGAEGFDPTTLVMNDQELPVEVVGHASAFPGMQSRRPLVVVDAAAVAEAYPGTTNPLLTETATTELWIRGDPERAQAALRDPGLEVFQVLTADQVKDLPRVSTVIETFSVLDVLGVASAILVASALLMYLQARQRSQIVAYGLSTRMGMSPAAHRRSLALEIAAMLGAAFVLGVGLGIGAAMILTGRLDPLPVVPPDPLLVVPTSAVIVALVALVAVTAFGAWLTARRAAAVHLGEAMRVAE
ncbi:MAG TPA: ABC transporter permease [Actinomycetota bacterium]|nr:ABC transporter permease [Actinomycetota bacterium]